MNQQEVKTAGCLGSVAFVVLLILILIPMYGCPKYEVWRQGIKGEAELNKAKQTKQIQIEQARGEKEAAQLKAEAIAILGASAQKYPEYRQQEYLGAFSEALQNGSVQLIYVPTEANIPILERK